MTLETHHVSHRRDDDVLDRCLGDDLRQRCSEVLQDDNGLRAAVLQLVLKLSRRIKRIDVDDGQTSPKDCGNRDRILQHIGHHHRDAIAFDKSARLKPCGHGSGVAIELGIGDGLAHAAECWPVAILSEGHGEQIADRLIL